MLTARKHLTESHRPASRYSEKGHAVSVFIGDAEDSLGEDLVAELLANLAQGHRVGLESRIDAVVSPRPHPRSRLGVVTAQELEWCDYHPLGEREGQ